ncbi:hypothetical protein ACFWIQ_08670 [Kitasatospora sp. NPDC127059]|uniref:hypothetical protein n=1 Tax=unclassified Kitasatospora TaxID=2633591 RepID=UPI00364A2405
MLRKTRALLTGSAVALALTLTSTTFTAHAAGDQSGIDACAREAQLAGFAKDKSGEGRNDDAIYAVAIAMAESGCDRLAVHTNQPTDPDPGTKDLGAWQINERWYPEVHYHDAEVVTAENWQDMGWSARKAFRIDTDGTGRGWASWAAWKLGTYQQYLGQARDAVYRVWQ